MKTNKISKFNLDAFTTTPPQLTAVVHIPHKDYFRVIDNQQLEGKFFNLVNNNGWWLISDEVIAECTHHDLTIKGLWKSELFHAIYQTGQNLLIPATFPLPKKEFWRETLQNVIDFARESWVKIESSNKGYDYRPSKIALLDEDDWQILPTVELFNQAFDERIITNFQQAEKYLPLIRTEEPDDDDPNLQIVPIKRPQKKFKN